MATIGEDLRLAGYVQARPQAQKALAVKGSGLAFSKDTILAEASPQREVLASRGILFSNNRLQAFFPPSLLRV